MDPTIIADGPAEDAEGILTFSLSACGRPLAPSSRHDSIRAEGKGMGGKDGQKGRKKHTQAAEEKRKRRTRSQEMKRLSVKINAACVSSSERERERKGSLLSNSCEAWDERWRDSISHSFSPDQPLSLLSVHACLSFDSACLFHAFSTAMVSNA